MEQETLIQVIALIIIVDLSLFFNPFQADQEGKMIFFGIVLAIIIFFIIFDLYKKIEKNENDVKLFNNKLGLSERIKNLEDFKNNMEKRFKNKKAEIDPRILLLLLIIFLIFLYIKSQTS